MIAADLAPAVARLGRTLRERGIGVGIGDEVDAARALARLRDPDREEVRWALRIALKIRHPDWARFDAILEGLWPDPPRPPDPVGSAPTASIDGKRPGRGAVAAPSFRPASPVEQRGGDSRGEEEGELPGYSPAALLRNKPFEELTPADLVAMERVLARLAARLAARRSRRLVPSPGRGVPDLRRSLRGAIATGGELLSIARRARAIEAPRLVFLCDTSGSMDAHARFLLAFVLALRRAARSTEVFAFNTELTRLTACLAPGAIGLALDRLAAAVPDWAGGTRIGDSLARFVAEHLPSRVDARTVVVVLSDGLDRGDPATLADAMRTIQARARKVIWLNPLLGDPRYAPEARGMAAALPFVDEFLPAHDLASLERLVPHLSA
ncbi:vWA domain-containing protein [Anaeromyxobacter oryzae]|uniref:VWFA domain-containing protein n=1 Tax=Anaeromyxobacter oryzae TaxID=2918170 RepID=A0ABM7WU59_9BACT|nr:VWA domain-containing protein [Anaeromyxobacter oryzae]BDG02927.1 hypothetical protein AMOR_19230 [Anaeromyxobacter oryzae]